MDSLDRWYSDPELDRFGVVDGDGEVTAFSTRRLTIAILCAMAFCALLGLGVGVIIGANVWGA